MVLRRVGRRFVDVLVNGTQVDSFEQTSEGADYDVAVSDGSESITMTVKGSVKLPPNSRWKISDQTGWEDREPDAISLDTNSYGQDYIEIDIRDGEGTVFSTSTESPSTFGFIEPRNNSGFRRTQLDNTSANETLIDYTLRFRFDGIQSGFSVNGATQS